MVVTKLNETLVSENNGTSTDPYLKPLGQVCSGLQRFGILERQYSINPVYYIMLAAGFGGNTLGIMKHISAVKCINRHQSMIQTLNRSCQFRFR